MQLRAQSSCQIRDNAVIRGPDTLAGEGRDSVRKAVNVAPEMLRRCDGESNEKTFGVRKGTSTWTKDFRFFEMGFL